MKFTILSHAAMMIESQGTSLITDPWLVGSTYWRSWWNYPKASNVWRDRVDLDYIYITHMHWDHFHGPSLRQLPRTAKVLIPDVYFERMKKDIQTFRFQEIIELPHGKTMRLGPGMEVTSYQYGLALDTTLLVTDGKTTLMDMNDCKLSGWPLRQVLKRHPKIDFMFRSHSSAQPYPFCVRAEDSNDLKYRVPEDYMSDFVDAARLTRARYSIPFASNHCFLHKETRQFNSTAVSPLDVKQYFDQHAPAGSECIVMIPGDSWSDEEGFRLQQHDYFTNRGKHLEEYSAEMAQVLEKSYGKEAAARLQFAGFEKYFEDFVRSIPRFTRSIFKPVIGFTLSNRPGNYWIVDMDQRKVYETQDLPANLSFRIDVNELVLRDCVYKRMFATWTPSKRLAVDLKKGKVRDFLIFLQLLDMHEYGYFPLSKMLNWRFVSRWAPRWREMGQYAGLLWKAIRTRNDPDPLKVFIPKISAATGGRRGG